MKKISTILGSTLGVLLIFSVISYAKNFIQNQDQKPAAKTEQALDVAGQIPEADAANEAATPGETTTNAVAEAQSYSATAYSLRGRTASGQYVTRGVIAADPRLLPIGTRVHVQAGPWSGEYLVADTGGAIRGRKIDIWTPSTREAMQFGRRTVKLTILSRPERRQKSGTPRQRSVIPPTATTTEAAAKQQK